ANSLRAMEIETSLSAGTRSRVRETKCFETLSISITPCGSFVDQRGIDGRVVIPVGVEVLGVGDRLPGEGKALRALLAPAEALGMVVEDERQGGTHAAEAVVEGHLGNLLDVQLAGLLRVVAGELETSLDRPQEAPGEIGPLGDGLVGGDDAGGEDLEADLDE